MAGSTAERILDVAHKLIADRGYAAFSYADIASEVKVSKATIHHHFPLKEDLVVAVLRRHRQRLGEGLAQMDGAASDPFDRLTYYMKYWEACIQKKTEPICIAALLGAELPSLPADVATEVRFHFADLHRWLQQTLELGEKQKSIRLTQATSREADLLMATVHGAMISARAYQSSAVFSQIVDATLQRLSPAAVSA
ncbi:TetR/AcrR family transcriptional regulator [Granulicella sp. dw_53]|uniref:TetR/AcrR family transcriptional regulator n=1 Tax=Granulicella sp. dw_53 TaxID=2719792 RepID=UPI001BD21D23|nr:TetR/AcrR family transcriptional regulator [Granulicella sp. dw_53]